MAPAQQPTDTQAPTSGTPSSRGSSSRSSSGSTAGSATRRDSDSGPSRILTRPSRVERTARRRPDTTPAPSGTQWPSQRPISISEMSGRSHIDQRPHHMLPPRPNSWGGLLRSPLSVVTTNIDTDMGAYTTSPTSVQGSTPSTPSRSPRAHTPDRSTQSLESGSGTSIPSGTPRQQQQGTPRPGSAVFGVPRSQGPDMEARTLDRVFEKLRSGSPGDLSGAVQDWWIVSSRRYRVVWNSVVPPRDHPSVVNYFSSKGNGLMTFFCQVAEELAASSDASPSTPAEMAMSSAHEAVDHGALSVVRTRHSRGDIPDLSRDP